tara:strand:+ start:2829 stop:3557 length:729 start_codon:yes stop_codon:yes gene_type:complete
MTNKINNVFITKETIKRLAKDVKDIYENPLEQHGIYYIHSDDDILSGQALIIGPKNTPYCYGNYLFTIKFPSNYPSKPPSVTYHTNDGVTRFNPNLYRSGKVCISILNTWKGPQWTSCQTISSILLSLCASVLNDTPLLNEPGITINHADYDNYNKIITYKNYEIAIADIIINDKVKINFPELHEIIKKTFLENYNDILFNLEKNDHLNDKIIETQIYKMKIKTSYKNVKNKIKNIYKLLKN